MIDDDRERLRRAILETLARVAPVLAERLDGDPLDGDSSSWRVAPDGTRQPAELLEWSREKSEAVQRHSNRPVALKGLTVSDLLELIRVFDAADELPVERDRRHAAEQALEELRDDLRGASNVREVLRRHGLTQDKHAHAQDRDLEMAEYYLRLTTRNGTVTAPVGWQRVAKTPPSRRPTSVGASNRINRCPLDPVEALRVIGRLYGFRTDHAAREALVRARETWAQEHPKQDRSRFRIASRARLDRAR